MALAVARTDGSSHTLMNVDVTPIRGSSALLEPLHTAERLDERLRSPARDRVPLPAIALGACAGYYVASLVGFQLRLLPATTSVLWPPNAALTAVLVLVSPRRWPLILLSVLPVHLLIQMHTDFPLPMIVGLFLTNCSEAVIAAGLMHYLSDEPSQLDTLRRLMVFFVAAVLVAPVLSSFGDAAAVMWFRGEPYWRVWQTRLLSNTLAELTVVPAVIGAVLTVVRWRRGARGRFIEGTVLASGVCATGWLAFSGSFSGIPSLGAMSTQMPLALQLPFLLWAAVRFGPTGTGLTVFTTSVLSAWTVVHGVGPFAGVPAATTVMALTLSLIVVAAALLCLATLIEERRQTQLAVRTRLQFEGLLSRLSAALVQLPGNEVIGAFEPWLGRIGRVLGLDCLTVFAAEDRSSLIPLYVWGDRRTGTVGTLADHMRWAHRSVQSQEPVFIADANASVENALESPLEPPLCRSGGAVPLIGEGDVIGAVAFGSIDACQWSRELVANTQLVGEVLASALRRKQSEDALRASELMKSAILQSLTSGVAVLDRSGCLLQMNDRWKQFARDRDWMRAEFGSSLIANCWMSFERGDRLAAKVVVAVCSVLGGSRDRLIVEHRTETGTRIQWWSLAAVPLNRTDGGAVITLTDITELRRAELEALRSRQELAHVSRVSTVGEMTASLAHQLNQPLAAIMTNAQTGVRILDSSCPDVAEIRAILVDIVNDDRRASDVIQRLRAFLRKGEFEMAKVNVVSAIRDVVDLASSEAIIRNIAVSVDADHDPLYARADRVQLQQVMLNLLHNAMEALNGRRDRARRISVECREADAERILVSVHDSGPGFRAGTEEVIFEPFYTTKATGMGMGLSIVRSILDAHGGSIRAANHPLGGAVFEFLLPATARTR